MNKILVDITVYNIDTFILKIINNNKDFTKVNYKNHILRCFITFDTYKELKKYYNIKIVREFNIKYIFNYIRNNFIFISSIIFGIVIFIILTHLIFNVEIDTNNIDLKKKLNNTLEYYGIKRLNFIKNNKELNDIKNNIISEYKDEIEWLEISLKGLNYVVTLEERKVSIAKKNEEYCNVYAVNDGIVTKVSATAGNIMVHENTYVRTGDLLISGDIKLNEEEKKKVCATGTIYGEVWYKANITVPKIEKIKNYTGNIQYNLEIANMKIFKSHYDNYDTKKIRIFSLLGIELYILKEEEYTYIERLYTTEELEEKVNNLIMEKVNISNIKNERILYKNILKKREFDSTIDIEIFVTVEKILGSNE